jgi:hypothetical protein
LFQGLDLRALGYQVTHHVASPAVMHAVIARDVG